MVAFEQTGLLELGECAINGRQTDVHIFAEQQAIDIVSRQVTYLCILKKFEYLEARERGFKPHALQFGGFAHGLSVLTHKEGNLFGYDIPMTAL